MKSVFPGSIPLLALIVILAAFQSCSNSGKERRTRRTLKEPVMKEAMESRVRDFVYPLPTSYETITMLNDLGASYILAISNPFDKVDKYFTEKSKALNLGIYGADLSYASTYQMKQETMFYLESSKKLTDDLGISGIINEALYEQVESNIDNREKLIEIITDTFYDTYDFLNRNKRGNLALLIIAGSWVEALYITTHISSSVYHNYDIVKIIHQQKNSISKIYELCRLDAEDPYVREIMTLLQPLKDIFDAVDTSFTEDQVNAVIREVEGIREKIVS